MSRLHAINLTPGRSEGVVAARAARGRSGFTLIEVMVSITIVSVLMVGMTAAVVLASRSIDPASPAAAGTDAATVLDRIDSELQLALEVDDFSPTAVTFTVPDRDKPVDGITETIRYAWSGTPGDPLTREFNYGEPVVVAEDVQEFMLATSATTSVFTGTAAAVNPNGWGYFVSDVTDAPIRVLFVTGSPGNDFDKTRGKLIASWGFTVTVITDLATQADFDAAVADADVAYVGTSPVGTNLGTKLTGATIGVVAENVTTLAALGISELYGIHFNTSPELQVVDADHPITSRFGIGPVTAFVTGSPYFMPSGALAEGLRTIATAGGTDALLPTVCVLETGAPLLDRSSAAGRRVFLPFMQSSVEMLAPDGQLIMQQAIYWAAGRDNPPDPLGLIALVVGDPAVLRPRDAGRKSLMESWGYEVVLVDDSDTDDNLALAAKSADVVYVGVSSAAGEIGLALDATTTGVVNENALMIDNFGFSSGVGFASASDMTISTTPHEITEGVGPGVVAVLTVPLSMSGSGSGVAPGLKVLGQYEQNGPDQPLLLALEVGAERYGGGSVAGRRVHLPFVPAEVGELTTGAQTLMRQAVAWAAGPPEVEGPGVPNDLELLLASHDDAPGGRFRESSLTANNWYAQYFMPDLPADTVSWSITRARLVGRVLTQPVGVMEVQIRTADDQHKPTATVLGAVQLLESSFPSAADWIDVEFGTIAGLDPTVGVCIVLRHVSDGSVGKWTYESGGSPMTPHTHRMTSSDAGVTWTGPQDTTDMRFFVYGTATTSPSSP